MIYRSIPVLACYGDPDPRINEAIASAAASAAADLAKLTGVFGESARIDEKGVVTVEVDGFRLPVADAVRKMRSVPSKYGNAFYPLSAPTPEAPDGAKLPMHADGRIDMSRLTSAQYHELRKTNPAALGLRPR